MDHFDNCPICSSVRLRLRPFGYRFEARWLQGKECQECGIIFIDPQPTVEQLGRLYSAHYFEGDFRCGHAGSYFDAESLAAVVDVALLDRLQAEVPRGTFLEVGCAGGALLNAARERGYTVTGIEFSEHAAALARARFGLNVVTGSLTGASLPQGSFDVVFMGDVIEHLPDPLATMKELHRIMKAGGLLVIHCPSQTNTVFSRLGFLAYNALGKRAVVNLPPYHLFEYRPVSLSFLLMKTGFDIRRLAQATIPPGRINLRGSVLQNLGKKILQYPNHIATKFFGVLGDRLEIHARRRSS